MNIVKVEPHTYVVANSCNDCEAVHVSTIVCAPRVEPPPPEESVRRYVGMLAFREARKDGWFFLSGLVLRRDTWHGLFCQDCGRA